MLERRYKVFLNPNPVESTKKQLLKQLKHSSVNNGVTNTTSSITSIGTPTQSRDEVEVSCPSYSKRREGIKQVAKSLPDKQELEHYLQNIQPHTEADAVQFWMDATEELSSYVINGSWHTNNSSNTHSNWACILCCRGDEWKAQPSSHANKPRMKDPSP